MAEQQAETVQKPAPKKAEGSGKIAVVLVRGLVGVRQGVKDTLQLLRLTRKNNCVVVPNTPEYMGMIQKVKDYITWGGISDATFAQIVEKRGEELQGRTQEAKGKYNYKALDVNGKKLKPYFRLNPPRKGFGRKGIKMPFKLGGALGDRGEKMNDLVGRML